MDADTTKPSSCWKISSCCSQQSAKGLRKCGLSLCCDLHFDLLRTRAGSWSLTLRAPPSYQTMMLSIHRCSRGTQNTNGGRHKILFFSTLLLSGLFAFPAARSLECVYNPHQSSTFNPLLPMSCHLQYSNFCG